MRAETLSIGNELLLGDVLDSNAHFITRKLTSEGVHVERMHVIPDIDEEIVKFLDYAFKHNVVDIVVTTGGLGPTGDDMTYQAVASWLGVKLYEDPRSLLYLQERVDLLNYIDKSKVRTLTPARRKMASIPHGGIPLFNPTGAAPGLWYGIGPQVLICLPGVPVEMEGIWEVEVGPRLKEFTAGYGYEVRHFTIRSSDESALAPIVAVAASRFPQVHFKTRPRRIGNTWEMKLDVAQFISEKRPSVIRQAVKTITESLNRAGIGIEGME